MTSFLLCTKFQQQQNSFSLHFQNPIQSASHFISLCICQSFTTYLRLALKSLCSLSWPWLTAFLLLRLLEAEITGVRTTYAHLHLYPWGHTCVLWFTGQRPPLLTFSSYPTFCLLRLCLAFYLHSVAMIEHSDQTYLVGGVSFHVSRSQFITERNQDRNSGRNWNPLKAGCLHLLCLALVFRLK